MKWTAHLQAPAPTPPPPAPTTAMVVQQPHYVDPYANANGYGNANAYGNGNAYGTAAGYNNANYVRVPMQQLHQQHNSAAVGSVVVGALAFCLSLVGFIPGSPVFYYSAGGILAIVGGIRALIRRRQGYGTNIAAPVTAIILGSLAVVFMLTSILIHATAATSFGTTVSPGTTSNAQGQSSGGGGAGIVVPVAPTFANDAQLTAYEQTAKQVATSIDENANGGMAYSSNPQWPVTLTVASNGNIMLPSGTAAGQLPSGQDMKYLLSDDKQSFEVLISGGTHQEIAVYFSNLNTFSWTCDPSDSACPPGGVPDNLSGGTDSGSGSTTNS